MRGSLDGRRLGALGSGQARRRFGWQFRPDGVGALGLRGFSGASHLHKVCNFDAVKGFYVAALLLQLL